MDIQNDYFQNGNYSLDGSEKASLVAKKTLNFFREKNLPIVHIKHINKDKKAGFFLENTPGSQIHKSVKPINGEKILIKYKPDSFIETDLDEYLKRKNTQYIVMIGMQTNVCILATSNHAKDLNYKTIIIKDAVAALSKSIHESTLNIIDDKFAHVTSFKRFISKLK